jgi:hypothetical protein
MISALQRSSGFGQLETFKALDNHHFERLVCNSLPSSMLLQHGFTADLNRTSVLP